MVQITNRVLTGKKVGTSKVRPLGGNMRKSFPSRYNFGSNVHEATGLPMPPMPSMPKIVYVYVFVGVQ